MLSGKNILLGISGGIAAYKGPMIVRELVRAGATVRVVLTRGATQFVAPLALQAVSHAPVGVDLFDPAYEEQIGHIEMARWPDAILIAPATAHLIGRAAHGLCDDLLTTVLCATTAPVVVAPAMNTQMLANPAVQDNIARLRDRLGYQIVTPDSGELACQEVGAGRMPDPPILLEAVARALATPLLQGRRVLVTAGPTIEPIDPVRFISNRSSGKMGFAIARLAARLGAAQVTLIAGPSSVETPPGVARVNVESAAQMHQAVFDRVLDPHEGSRPHVVVKAAAVADWTPQQAAEHKLKKQQADEQMALPMRRTRDILKELGQLDDHERPFLIGFAAETRNVEEYAAGKLLSKRADMIVGNIVLGPESAFGADRSSVVFFDRDGRQQEHGPAAKEELAAALWSFAAQSPRWGAP